MTLYLSAAVFVSAVFKTKVIMQIYSFGRTSASPPFSLLLPKPNSAETGISKLF